MPMKVKYPYPIIFVHGIKGAWLKNEYPVDFQDEVLWNGLEIMGHYDDLSLHVDDASIDQDAQHLVSPHQAIALVYESFVEELRQEVTPYTYVFRYDWRKDNRASADYLKFFIDLILKKVSIHQGREVKKVTLIGHSMGGLVIKWCALKSLGDQAADKIDRIITVATPYRGSLNAVEALLPGARYLFGLESKKAMRHSARTMPGVYQLLPAWDGAVVSRSTRENLSIFDPRNWQDNLVSSVAKEYGEGFLAKMLANAAGFSEVVSADYPARLRNRFFCLYGVGSATWNQVTVDPKDANWFDFEHVGQDDEGDGTVHVKSSNVEAGKTHPEDHLAIRDILGGQHAQMMNHGGVQDEVVKFLTGNEYLYSFESLR